MLHVLDENDNPPTFPSSPIHFFTREHAPIGSFIGQATAFDLDSNTKIRYQLINPPKFIGIDSTSGILRVIEDVDHDEAAFYKFKIKAIDPGGLFSETVAHLFIDDVNNHLPQFLGSTHKAEINENAQPDTFVYQFRFTDQDSGSPFLKLSIFLVNNFNFKLHPFSDHLNHFKIDNNGRVTIRNHLDRENIDKYELNVTLCDDFPPHIGILFF